MLHRHWYTATWWRRDSVHGYNYKYCWFAPRPGCHFYRNRLWITKKSAIFHQIMPEEEGGTRYYGSPKSPQYSTKLCYNFCGIFRTTNHQKVRNIPLNYAIIFVEYFGQPITKKSVQYHFVIVTFCEIFRTFLWLLGQCGWEGGGCDIVHCLCLFVLYGIRQYQAK